MLVSLTVVMVCTLRFQHGCLQRETLCCFFFPLQLYPTCDQVSFSFFHVVVPAVLKALSYDELRGYTSVGKLRSLIHPFLSDSSYCYSNLNIFKNENEQLKSGTTF